MALTMIQGELADILAGIIAATAPLDPAANWIGLYTAIAAPVTPTLVLADLTEATYTGYARQTITAWEPPFIDAAGYMTTQSPSKEFRPTDAVTPNTILGSFVANAVSGGDLVGVSPLAVPFPMANAFSVLTIIAKFGMPRTLNFGTFQIST